MILPATQEYLAKWPVTERQALLLAAFRRPGALKEIAARVGTRHHNSNYMNIRTLMKKGLLGQRVLLRNQPGSYYITLAGRRWLKSHKEELHGIQAQGRSSRSVGG